MKPKPNKKIERLKKDRRLLMEGLATSRVNYHLWKYLNRQLRETTEELKQMGVKIIK